MVVLAYVLRVGQFDDKSNNYNYKLDFDRVAYLAYMWQNTNRLLIINPLFVYNSDVQKS